MAPKRANVAKVAGSGGQAFRTQGTRSGGTADRRRPPSQTTQVPARSLPFPYSMDGPLLSSQYQPTGDAIQGYIQQRTSSERRFHENFHHMDSRPPSAPQHSAPPNVVHEDHELSDEELLGSAEDLSEDQDVHLPPAVPTSGPTPSADRVGSVDGHSTSVITKQFIEPVGNDSFRPHSIIRRIIPECVIACYKNEWTTISTCDPKARAAWFAKFQELFTWDPAHDTWVKQNFYNKVSKLLRARWGYARKKEGKIPYMSTPEGVRLAKHRWEDANWKQMAERNKGNARGETSKRGQSRHRMGALPAHAAKDKLTIKLGREPTTREVYKKFKIMDDGRYLDPDGEEIVGRLDDIERRRLEEDPDGTQYSQVDDVETYAREVGVTARGGLPRLLGSAATRVAGSQFHRSQQTVSSQSVSSVDSSQTVVMQQLRQMSDTMTSRLDRQDQNIQHMTQLMQEQQDQTIQRMTELLQRALASRPPN